MTRLDGICTFVTSLSVVTTIATLVALLAGLILSGAESNCWTTDAEAAQQRALGARILGKMKYFIITLVVSIAASLFTPTTKEFAAMLVIPKIANSETVQQLGADVVELAHQWFVELAPKKKAE